MPNRICTEIHKITLVKFSMPEEHKYWNAIAVSSCVKFVFEIRV